MKKVILLGTIKYHFVKIEIKNIYHMNKPYTGLMLTI